MLEQQTQAVEVEDVADLLVVNQVEQAVQELLF